jgi:hypothetical protein
VIFTPFSEITHQINWTDSIRVPDISFNRTDLIRFFEHLDYETQEHLVTDTQYRIEHVFFLKKT